MAAGLNANFTAADYNNQWGAAARDLNAALLRIQQLKIEFDTVTVAALQAAPFNMALADVNTLKSAAQDMDNLRAVYQGNSYVTFGATVGTGVVTVNTAAHFGYDFTQFIKLIYGFGV